MDTQLRKRDPAASLQMFTPEVAYSTARVAEMTGLSPRQLDWLDRTGALHPTRPARGSGSRRLWSESDLARARLAGCLRDLGASTAIVGTVLGQLPGHPDSWPEYLFVSPDGEVREFSPAGPCWIGVSVRRLLAERPETEHDLAAAV